MARTRALDPISIGANLQSEKYRNKTALPNEHDMDAQLFGEIGKAVGDKPRGWGALVSGLAKGAEYGAKTKSVAKRKEDYDKYEKVMDYLGEVNNAAIERKQWYETREMARQQFLPQVLSYADNIDRLDPQSQRIMAQNILDGYSRATGDDLKLVSIDGSDPFMVTVQTPKGAQILDVRTLFAGDELLQQKMAMKMPEYQMKLQEEREAKQRKFDLEQQKIDLEAEYAPMKYETQQRRIEETARRNDQAAIKSDIKLGETLGKKIDASREFLVRAPQIKDIVNKYPDVFQSVVSSIWKEEKEPGFIKNFIKSVQNKWDEDRIAAFKVLEKDINKMTLDVANGFSRPNMFIEKIGSKAVPNLDMNAKGFLVALDNMISENETNLNNNLQRMEILEQQDNKSLSKQYRKSSEEVANNINDDWSDIGTLVQ